MQISSVRSVGLLIFDDKFITFMVRIISIKIEVIEINDIGLKLYCDEKTHHTYVETIMKSWNAYDALNVKIKLELIIKFSWLILISDQHLIGPNFLGKK